MTINKQWGKIGIENDFIKAVLLVVKELSPSKIRKKKNRSKVISMTIKNATVC